MNSLKITFSSLFLLLLSIFFLSSCNESDYDDAVPTSLDDRASVVPSGNGTSGGVADSSGIMTAGEWNDLDNWTFG